MGYGFQVPGEDALAIPRSCGASTRKTAMVPSLFAALAAEAAAAAAAETDAQSMYETQQIAVFFGRTGRQPTPAERERITSAAIVWARTKVRNAMPAAADQADLEEPAAACVPFSWS